MNGATDSVTNNGTAGNATQPGTLDEGGGAPGTVYSGTIADGTGTTAVVHTGGSLLLNGANGFSGGLTILGGVVNLGANQTLGSTSNVVTVQGGALNTGPTKEVVKTLTVSTSGGAGGTVTINGGSTLTAGSILVTGLPATLQVAAGGTLTGALTNAGEVANGGVFNGTVVANAGGIGNAGLWNGIVASNNGAIGNVGVWNGAVAQNTGNIGNDGAWNGNIFNAAGGVLVTGDGGPVPSVITGNVSSRGILVAFGGTFNGNIGNTGTMVLPGPGTFDATVYGPLIAAASGGTLSGDGIVGVNGNLINAGGGTLQVAAKATLTITGLLSNVLDANGPGIIASAGTVNAALSNAGVVQNAGIWSGGVVNGGSIGNLGRWIGDVSANSGAIVNAQTGVWTGGVLGNGGSLANYGIWAGTLDNKAGGVMANAAGATWTGAIGNEADATIFNYGLLAGGLNTSGTVYAGSGAINGGINNAGLFDVAGVVASDMNFANLAGGALAVTGTGAYTIAGSLSNAAGATVYVGAQATLTDDLVNSGLVANNGTYNANVFNNPTGQIYNNGIWNGNASNSGAITNGGTWTGTLQNGGLLTNGGIWAGDVTNLASGQVYAQAGSKITGTLTNAGYFNSTTSTVGTLVNSGTIDLTSGGLTSNSITATTYVSQAGAKAIALVNLGANAAGGTADQFVFNTITGAAPTQLTLNLTSNSSPVAYHPTITVIAGDTNNVFQLNPASLSALQNGFVSYSFADGILTGQVNAAKASTAGIQLASITTTLNSDFFQDWQPFITAPQDPDVNSISGGPWIRGKYGNETISSTALTAGQNPTASRVGTEFSGFQIGGDVGVFNINKTGWNIIGGVTGGEVFATSREQIAGSIKGVFEIPFVGAYGALTNGPFHADVLYRHDFYGLKLTDVSDGLQNQPLAANGDSINFDSGYNFQLGTFGANLGNFFIEPNGSLILSKVSINPLAFSALKIGTLSFDDIESVLGRAGFRFGTSITTGKLALQPFMTAAVWHEFEGNSTSTFDPTTSAVGVPLSVTRVGTFGQFGVGLNGELLGSNVLGTVRADFRVGDKVDGQSVTAQLRYQF